VFVTIRGIGELMRELLKSRRLMCVHIIAVAFTFSAVDVLVGNYRSSENLAGI
jgi:hypothetical protein